MLLRNAHWILLAVCLLLVYVFYTASDESPTGAPNGVNDGTIEAGRSLTEKQSLDDDNELTCRILYRKCCKECLLKKIRL